MKTTTLSLMALLCAPVLFSQSLCFDPANDNRFETTAGCFHIGLMDVDNDGELDVLSSAGGSLLSFSRSLGNGTFEPAVELPVPGGTQMVLIDSNTDGFTDVVRYGNGFLHIAMNNGNGTFATAAMFDVGVVQGNSELAAGDITGDGWPDFAVNDEANNLLHVFVGGSNGLVQSTFSLTTLQAPTNVQIGDVNNDGQADLVCSYNQVAQITIFPAQPGENFTPVHVPISGTVGSGLAAIEIADFNNDGFSEVAVAGDLSQLLFVRWTNGSFQQTSSVFMGVSAYGFITGDWNADNAVDVAFATLTSSGITTRLNNGTGGFPAQTNFFASSGGPAEEMAAGDLDNDGILDIVVANGNASNFAFLKGAGNGVFGPQYLLAAAGASGLATGDIDNDGDIDVVSTNAGSMSTSVLAITRNNGDGTFQSTVMLPNTAGAGECDLVHVNNDAFLDLVTHTPSGYAVRMGNGTTNFANAILYSTTNMGAGGERTLTIGDFNGDGSIDLAGSRPGDNEISIVFGAVNGTFAEPIVLTGIDYPRSLFDADFNNDGIDDLIACASTIDEVWVYMGNANGVFSSPLVLQAVGNPQGIAVFDANGDDSQDLIIAAPNANALYTFLGNGAGGFSSPTLNVMPTNSNSTGIDFGDFNQDGIFDVVGAFYQNNAAGVFFGNGNGSFEPALLYGVDSQPILVDVSDFNGDGIDDLATLNSGANTVSVVLNNSAFITANGDLAFCNGGSVLLSATGGFSYEWSTGETTASIVVSEPGSYFCSISNQAGTCVLITPSLNVEVFSSETVSFFLQDDLVCLQDETVVLTGGVPGGGQYTGPGVVAGIFYPSDAGVGVHEIEYDYEDAGGCTNGSATAFITVENCISVGEMKDEIRVYPTVTDGFVFVEGCAKNDLRLLDSSGRLVVAKYQCSSKEVISLEALATGMYTLLVTDGIRFSTHRIWVK